MLMNQIVSKRSVFIHCRPPRGAAAQLTPARSGRGRRERTIVATARSGRSRVARVTRPELPDVAKTLQAPPNKDARP